MDSSPLVLQAQVHARKAAKANTPTTAVEEHEHAAGQFAKAAQDTVHSEALRTLHLLEEHHQKLARLIRFRATQPIKATDGNHTENSSSETSNSEAHDVPAKSTSKPLRHPGLPSNALPNRATRDLGLSIASNLASARGIPAHRQRKVGQTTISAVTQQNAEGKIVRPHKQGPLIDPNLDGRKHEKSAEELRVSGGANTLQEKAISTGSKEAGQGGEGVKADEPFNRFYTTVETLFSRLSAPLAFAGLPLNAETEAPSTVHEPKAAASRPKIKTRATASPEYSRLFSPAAIRALREDTGTTALNTTESFYVVPPEGGTASYASILARHTQHQLQQRGDAGADEQDLSDEFVDAREKPGDSPKVKRKAAGGRSRSGKTLEELEWENQTLKTTCDDLAKRLHQFEFSSQASYQALHQSIRAVSHNAGDSHALETEAKLESLQKDMADLKKENEKLNHYYRKYKDQLTKLRDSAKEKRRESKEHLPE